MAKIFVVGARGIPFVEGGAEKNAEMIFPLIVDEGYDVTLCGISRYINSDDYRGVKLTTGPASSFLKTDKLLYYVTCLFSAIRLRPRIVHLQGLGAAFFLWAYKLMGVKVVARYGSADYMLSKWGFFGRMGFLFSEWQLRFADAIISVAPSLTRRLAERGIKGNVYTIPNALDIPRQDDESEVTAMVRERQPYVLTVGRVTSQKNLEKLIAGFRFFKQQTGLPHRLLIVGGLDESTYAERIKALCDKDVELVGRISRQNLGAVYKGADIYISASVHEGNSNATLEAISYGCPLLLSGIAENRDMNLPEHHFFDQTDPEAIAQALKTCSEAPELMRVDTSRFMTWRDVATETIKVYREIGAPAEPAVSKVAGLRKEA